MACYRASTETTYSYQSVIRRDRKIVMSIEMYKDHRVVWAATYNEKADSWIPEASVSWHVLKRYRFQHIQGPPQKSEVAARAMAKQLAEAWIDERGRNAITPRA
jgi:hypothetical protein